MSDFIEKEQKARKWAIWIILLMTGIWIVLSFMSFIDTGDRVRPRTAQIHFNDISALKGKQVFQSYNCMDCHTIVGNGAYFAPDLTKIYDSSGPAWLRAYLGSPGTYPTKAIVNVQLQDLAKSDKEMTKDIDEYLDQYPGAKERVERRGGVEALMPNLQFTAEEIDALIAYFIYTGKINTAGWPPKVIASPEVIDAEASRLEAKSGLKPHSVVSAAGAAAGDNGEIAALSGEDLSKQYACAGCHSVDGSEVIGPTYKGLFGSQVKLDDGTTVTADEDYLRRSILQATAETVEGYPRGVMPNFEGIISDDEVDALVEYIKSVK